MCNFDSRQQPTMASDGDQDRGYQISCPPPRDNNRALLSPTSLSRRLAVNPPVIFGTQRAFNPKPSRVSRVGNMSSDSNAPPNLTRADYEGGFTTKA
ncbi:hypothetical protein EV363DRAFT_1157042 [Boletus edulis]|uniref:Uncharacterized protein n=1 Tax=Boletus edulis BED1 TaxID=1328754 RepID=A0AAD4B9N9_BOLED|nr:hypothetical protein EV363DRAFT_1157042 [Boletus edulis]KAF8415017.1 hypothetical protein L210DRAFT_3588564 [Boletus edulis BED1]